MAKQTPSRYLQVLARIRDLGYRDPMIRLLLLHRIETETEKVIETEEKIDMMAIITPTIGRVPHLG